MKGCTVHIGWHKTGTTAIQQAALRQRAALRSVDIHYPGWHHNHGPQLVSAVRTATAPYYAELFVPPLRSRGMKTFRQHGNSLLASAFAAAKGRHLLLSGEDLCMLDEAEIGVLKARLSSATDTFRVVAYLRNHVDYLNSALQQMVRMGFTLEQICAMVDAQAETCEGLRVMTPLPHYGRRLQRWVSVFGRENVAVHDYDQLRYDNTDIVGHFFTTHFGADATAAVGAQVGGRHEGSRSNASFSAPAIQLLNDINQANPLYLAGAPNPAFVFNIQRFLADAGGARLAAPVHLYPAACRAWEEDVSRLSPLLGTSFAAAIKRPAIADFAADTEWSEKAGAGQELAIATIMRLAVEEQNKGGREKFFSNLNSLRDPAKAPTARKALATALFQLRAPELLISCTGWLIRAGEAELALAYAKAARDRGAPNAQAKMLIKQCSAMCRTAATSSGAE